MWTPSAETLTTLGVFLVTAVIYLALKRLCLTLVRRKKKLPDWLKSIPSLPTGKNGTHSSIIEQAGGINPCLRKLHDSLGDIVHVIGEDGTPVVSVASPAYIKTLIELGNRPRELWGFTKEFLGENNLQVSKSLQELKCVLLVLCCSTVPSPFCFFCE